jgi:hypothetical protein
LVFVFEASLRHCIKCNGNISTKEIKGIEKKKKKKREKRKKKQKKRTNCINKSNNFIMENY